MMKKHTQVGVIGSTVFAPRFPERTSLEEALHTATKNALRDAGIGIEDIDGVVVACNDQMDGRAIGIMMASGPVGGVSRDILSTPSAAEHAFVLAALRVRSGMYKAQLVVAWSPLETDNIKEAQRLGADPYFNRALPLDDLSAHALQANALEAKVPGLRAAVVGVTEQNRRHGMMAYPEYAAGPREPAMISAGKMLRWPISAGMVTPPAFGVVAMVVASEEFIAEHPVGNHGKATKTAWLHGMGWATETGWLGDRDLATLPSLRAATGQAYEEAGIDAAAPAFDLAEVADASPYQQLVALEGLGLCDRSSWVESVKKGDFLSGGKLPVNLSGGALSFNPVFCTGLMRINEAANQARGCAGAHQQAAVKKTVAHGASGFAMQYNTVVVFGHEPRKDVQ